MGDFVVFLARALSKSSQFYNLLSPVSWPLLVFALVPLYIVALSLFVWIMRGNIWPVSCAYPKTTKKHACKNAVAGEWRRCHVHRRRRLRKTDGHVIVANLRRWQTVTRGGQIIDRRDQIGRGVWRARGRASTLLFRYGYARHPMDVAKFLPNWYIESRELGRRSYGQIREFFSEPSAWKKVFFGAKPVVGGVSERLPVVIRASRASVYLSVGGLSFVGLAYLMNNEASPYIEYLAAACFLGTWASLKQGVWYAESMWAKRAWRDVFAWGWPFALFSVAGGVLIA